MSRAVVSTRACRVVDARTSSSSSSGEAGRRARASSSSADVGRRRVVLTSTVLAPLATAALATTARASEAGDLVRRGMAKFAGYDVVGAVRDFDEAIAVDSRMGAYLWQRGLALYYADDFDGAARQFREDVAMNPNDTEESVWCFASEARDPVKGVEYAREHMLKTGRDARPVMASVFELFERGTEEAEEALRAAGGRSANDEFYALMYLGLWREINGDEAGAKEFIKRANRTAYARLSGDYMASVTRVHERARGW